MADEGIIFVTGRYSIGLPLALIFGADVSIICIRNKGKLKKQAGGVAEKTYQKDRSQDYLINRRIIVRVDLGAVKGNRMFSQVKFPFRLLGVVLRR